MKWTPKKQIKDDAERIIKRFAFFSITEWIPTDKDRSATRGSTVWLETVYIKQIRIEEWGGELGGCSAHWDNRQFVSKQEYEKYLNQ